jgi:hypothetical protein
MTPAMLMKKRQGDFRTLNGLHTMLRAHIVNAPDRHHRDEAPVEYVLNGLKFAVIKAGAAELSSSATAEDRRS